MDNGLIYIIRIKGKPFFNDIRRALPNINSRTLSTRLKEFSSINPTGGLSEWTKLLIKTIE
ncbi:MAG: winged helix-turn-helix transcriptional regulator [Candidatus Heimdallarchaeaceae archaeon]